MMDLSSSMTYSGTCTDLFHEAGQHEHDRLLTPAWPTQAHALTSFTRLSSSSMMDLSSSMTYSGACTDLFHEAGQLEHDRL